MLLKSFIKEGVSNLFRVVLDTNVFVSSIFWGGDSHKVVEKALSKEIQVFTSIEIIQELEKVLKRDFNEPEEYIKRQTNLILGYSEVVKVDVKVEIVKDDPEDNKIIECAISAKANYIITNDTHLLKLKNHNDIKIITPKEFLRALIPL